MFTFFCKTLSSIKHSCYVKGKPFNVSVKLMFMRCFKHLQSCDLEADTVKDSK